jgi:signal transduction histidine kinase
MVALWWLVMTKMVRISKINRITSIADFVASRYGKSQLLGGIVTVIAVVGVVPYLSLQLKAVSNSFTILLHYPEIVMPQRAATLPVIGDTTLYIALILAAFTIVFGTRHLDATERHEGMVAAIAFESVVKLVAFLAVGLFVTFGMYGGFADIFDRAAAVPKLTALLTVGADASFSSWASLTLLSMLSVMFLPRQFQVGVVENVNEDHLRRAIWQFPLYLLLINVFVLPIALGGLLHFPGGTVDADTFVLTLPMARQQEALALLVFIGGLSAGTGMIIVEVIALSTMVCNDLVMPFLLRRRWAQLQQREDLSGLLLGIRRAAIVIILVLGYIYFRAAGEAYALVGIGLISFAAVAQFAPVIFGGIFWKSGTRNGAIAALGAGFLVWAYTLLLPSFARSGWLPISFLEQGPFGIELLRPLQLFGLAGLDQISHCMFWSMLVNIGFYVGVSLAGRPDAAETSQATLFVDVLRHGAPGSGSQFWRGSAHVDDLLALVGRFLGRERARQAFAAYARQRNAASVEVLEADAGMVHFAETQLAGAIGSASARVMVASVVKEEPLGLDEVMNILDEASQVRAYSRQLEQKQRELEAATRELREANERLKELDRLKDDFMSSVTHELRTPLTSIRLHTEMLEMGRGRTDGDARARSLGTIRRECERLQRLIDQLLDFARIERGRMQFRLEYEEMGPLVGAIAEEFRTQAESEGFRYEVSIEAGLPELRVDAEAVRQMLLNLLSNAVKYSDSVRHIVVRAFRRDAELGIQVEDHGIGLDPAEHRRIFDEFYRVDTRLSSQRGGVGLGLTLVRRLAAAHGGRVGVESERGRGSRFTVWLPLAQAPARRPGAMGGGLAEAGGG